MSEPDLAPRLYAQLPLSHWRERVEPALALGWGVEIQLDDSALFMESPADVEALAAALGTGRPRLAHLPNYGIQLGCRDGTIGSLSLAIASRAVARAALLGCRQAVYHTYLLPTLPAFKLPGWLPTFMGRFASLVDQAAQHGVRLLVENVWERDGTLFDAIFAAFGDRVGMCLDLGHLHCFSRRDFAWWWGRYRERIEHVHLSDNAGDEDSHLPPGRGTVPYPDIWPVLAADPRLGFTLELPLADCPAAAAYLTGLA